MGQTESNPFPYTLCHYQLFQTKQIDKNDTVMIFKHLHSENLLSLRKLIFNDKDRHHQSYKQHQKRRQISQPSLQAIQQIATSQTDSICWKNYQIGVLWEIYDHNLDKEIKNRAAINKFFTVPQMYLLIESIARSLIVLQDNQIIHDKLRTANIYLKESGEIVMSDPLSLADVSNYEKVQSRRFGAEETQNIYLSPDQCSALQNSDRYINTYKDSIWVLGMMILECSELGNQSICYRNENTKINWNFIQRKIEKLQKNFNSHIAQIVSGMLTKTKNERITLHQIENMLQANDIKNQEKTKYSPQKIVQPQYTYAQNNTLKNQISIGSIRSPTTARFGSGNIQNFQKVNKEVLISSPGKNLFQDNQRYAQNMHPMPLSPYMQNKTGNFNYIQTTHSIYHHQPNTFNFTYNANIPNITNYPIIPTYPSSNINKIPYPQMPFQKNKIITNPIKSQQKIPYYHFPSVTDINSTISAGYYMVASKENRKQKEDKGLLYKLSEENEFVSPLSKQGYLFTHLKKKQNDSSHSSDNINPYLSKDLLDSIQKQKKELKSIKKSDSLSKKEGRQKQIQKNLPTQRSPSSHQYSMKNSQPQLQFEKLQKKQFIKEAESITYQNFPEFYSKVKGSIPLEPQTHNIKKTYDPELQYQPSSIQPLQDLEYIVQCFQEGSKYEGYKLGTMRHGRGIFYFQDGGNYEGDWVKNKMHGFGKLFYQSGNIAYEGYWIQDHFSGKGKLYNDQPQQVSNSYRFDCQDFDEIDEIWQYYQGQFKQDLKDGRGKLMLTNGEYFIGEFESDIINGKGTFFGKNSIVKGRWQNNRLVEKF